MGTEIFMGKILICSYVTELILYSQHQTGTGKQGVKAGWGQRFYG